MNWSFVISHSVMVSLADLKSAVVGTVSIPPKISSFPIFFLDHYYYYCYYYCYDNNNNNSSSSSSSSTWILPENWKTMEYEGDGYTNFKWCTWNGLERLEKETGGTENQRKNRDHTFVSTFETLTKHFQCEIHSNFETTKIIELIKFDKAFGVYS